MEYVKHQRKKENPKLWLLQIEDIFSFRGKQVF